MPRADTGSFNRLLTSVGLLLLAASLVIPYFFFGNTDTLEIPESEMEALTPGARATLEGRQEAIADLECWVVWGAIGLAVVGVGCLAWGGFRLRRAQASEDAESDLRKAQAQTKMRSLSPPEDEERREERAREDLVAEVLEPATEATPTAASAEPTPPEVKGEQPTEDLDIPDVVRTWTSRAINERVERAARIEGAVASVLGPNAPEGFRFTPSIGFSGSEGQLQLDGLFERVEDGTLEVVLGLKVPSGHVGGRTLRTWIDELTNQATKVERMTARRVWGWLVVVFPTEVDVSDDDLILLPTRAASARPRLQTTAIRESQIDELPGHFERLFRS